MARIGCLRAPLVHNLNLERQRQIEHERLLAGLEPFIVPGWQLDQTKAQIVVGPTILGHFQRGQQLLLRCRRDDCRRRVDVDLRAATEARLGDRDVKHLLDRLRCRHWSGCALVEHSYIAPRGVPLVGYLVHRDVLIAIACVNCEARALLPPREVIRRLMATGRGDGSIGIHSLATAVRGPCGKCLQLDETSHTCAWKG